MMYYFSHSPHKITLSEFFKKRMCASLKIQNLRKKAATAVLLTSVAFLSFAFLAEHFTELALYSAAFVFGSSPFEPVPVSSVASSKASSELLSVSSDGSAFPSASSATNTETDVSSSAVSVMPEKIGGAVKETDLSGGGNLIFQNVRLNSKSASKIDLKTLLQASVTVKKENRTQPRVLIYHTHTSEAYLDEFTGTYPADFDARTDDAAHSVILAGDVLTRALNTAGIITVHDTTYHDDPAYRGAYGRSLETVEAYLAQYPSIEIVLDIHRDCLQQSDGTRLKPTAVINGKKAAQIMLVSGCDDKNTLGFPNWRQNLSFAAQLQNTVTQHYTTLMRPIYCWNVRYNAHVSPTALLVEFGTEANTDEEIAYSASLFAECLIEWITQHEA